ncbi:hypothetical protein I4I73_31870 [Pseudonocardia sp. KRD-184]|uniref:Uncharacterized protein n=1 Tax=Pseudonocardia oceani TaxID=2792013 RepID=A0ABS6U3K1_9PSEU|nr:hypothetical protein [Pseudonocardia oceani]MBW0093206.1 hypothetical protein [Pseudonocardia oceani]MBW0100583.1 hypothetical protein [Pseudonocardia oceani]MBW0112620.1 hypothetical protein [Pseudonocardia oceani]MBW0125993.1 hypothetical protein [Pseudonocardia oceani]MBW0126816.1 hypothetical protein [Pseudonocardia oceani]
MAELEAETERLLAGDDGIGLEPAPAEPLRYEALTVVNDALRADRGWTEIDLDAALSPELRAEFGLWQSRQRLQWGVDDVAAVALAGLVGMGATWFDSTIDRAVRSRLKGLKESEPFATWEKESKRLAIDHFAPGSTAHTHRLGSGHDLLRFWTGLQQVRTGEFLGLSWIDGERRFIRADRYNPLTAPYRQVASIGEALTVTSRRVV